MKRVANPRKARFLAALRIAGITMDEWATSQRPKVAQGYVSNVLTGRRSNPDLERKIDAFAAKHLERTVAA